MKLHEVCAVCCDEFKNLIIRELIIDTTSVRAPSTPSTGKASSKWKSVKVKEVLSAIYKLNYLDQLSSTGHEKGGQSDDEDKEEIALCGECASILTQLYRYYEEVNQSLKEESYLSHKIQKVDSMIQNMNLSTNTDKGGGQHGERNKIDHNKTRPNEKIDLPQHKSRTPQQQQQQQQEVRRISVQRQNEPNNVQVSVRQETTSTPLVPFDQINVPSPVAEIERGEVEILTVKMEPSIISSFETCDSAVETFNSSSNNYYIEDSIEMNNDDDGSADPGMSAVSDTEDRDPLEIFDVEEGEEEDVAVFEDSQKCPLCSNSYLSPCDLTTHLFLQHVKKGSTKCPICFKELSFGYMKFHLRCHSGYKPNACPAPGCRRSFTGISNLYKHLQSSHKGQKYDDFVRTRRTHRRKVVKKAKPVQQEEESDNDNDDTDRLSTTTSSATFTGNCPLCSDTYKSEADLCSHIFKHHTPMDSVTCPVCLVSMGRRGPLKLHILRHCGGIMSFRKLNKLKQQKKSSQLRPSFPINNNKSIMFKSKRQKFYLCRICGRNCSSPSGLQVHVRTHTGDKPYKCLVEGCGYACSQSYNLKLHTGSHHRRMKMEKEQGDDDEQEEVDPAHNEEEQIEEVNQLQEQYDGDGGGEMITLD